MVDVLLWVAALAAVSGVTVLRAAWALDKRSLGANAAGWAMLAAAAGFGGAAAGAWGVAVAALVAMTAAAALLGWAALMSPPGRERASNRRVKMLPEAGEPLRLGRRLATFALVGVAGFAASIALAIGLRWLVLAIGWSEANANSLALFAVPLAWGVLATILLMQHTRRSQIATLAIASAPLIPALLAGS
jgi:hypothetical protein